MAIVKRLAAAFGFLAVFSISANANAETGTLSNSFSNSVSRIMKEMGPLADARGISIPLSKEAMHAFSEIRMAMDAFGTAAFPVRDYQTFDTVCGPLNELTIRIQLGGSKRLAPLRVSPEAAARQQMLLSSANATKHQDIVVPLLGSQVKCMALHMPFFERFWESLPANEKTSVRAEGLRKMRSSLASMYAGIAMTGNDPGIRPANRMLAMKAAAEFAGAYARAMPLVQRKAALEQFGKSAPGLVSRYPTEYASIALAFSDTGCTGLCLVP